MAAETRLEDGHLGIDARAVEQNGLDGFGDAVAADFFRTETRHEADDQAADDGDESNPTRAVDPAGPTVARLRRW